MRSRRRTSAADQIDVLIYGGVCREYFEPATACRVACGSGRRARKPRSTTSATPAWACSTAWSRSPTGSSSARFARGWSSSCETAREINEIVIDQMLENQSMDFFKRSLATLTGGSGAVAVLAHRRLVLGIEGPEAAGRREPDRPAVPRALPLGHRGDRAGRSGVTTISSPSTDAAAVLTHGVELGKQTWRAFLRRLGWADGQVDKVICHQVGSSHRETILKSLGIPESKDFSTFPTWATWAPSRCR